jgi:hypothetical protein
VLLDFASKPAEQELSLDALDAAGNMNLPVKRGRGSRRTGPSKRLPPWPYPPLCHPTQDVIVSAAMVESKQVDGLGPWYIAEGKVAALRGRPRTFPAQVVELVRLRRDGLSMAAASLRLGYSESWAKQWMHRLRQTCTDAELLALITLADETFLPEPVTATPYGFVGEQ